MTNNSNTPVRGDIFKHYKGHLYEFLYFAKHSETLEQMVVYRRLQFLKFKAFEEKILVPVDWDIWVRPSGMFFENLPDGTPRFCRVTVEDLIPE